jgi:type II secretory pathway pseudopilin PulG
MRNFSKIRKRGSSGFSLVEMLITVAILIIIMAAVFQQINKTQKRYRAEESKLDMTQGTREFMDQMVRDLRQAGYPNAKMYDGGNLATPIMNPATSDERNAVGLVSFTDKDIWFEGDVDGDGDVDSVRYTFLAGPGNTCPCQLRRAQVQKVNATPPTGQNIAASYTTALDGLINSSDANGAGSLPLAGTMYFKGGSVSTDVYFGNYKTVPVFRAFNAAGQEVFGPLAFTQADYDASPKTGIYAIRTITINLNVMSNNNGSDLQTNMRPVSAMTASVRVVN